MNARTLVIALLALPVFGQTVVLDVCTAAGANSKKAVFIRGTGALAKGSMAGEAGVLFDYTCPLGTANGFVLPTAVLVDSPSFAGPLMKTRFLALKQGSVFQALIMGRLECATPFRIVKGDDGDIIGANGYGPLKLYRCRMRHGQFRKLHVIDTESHILAR